MKTLSMMECAEKAGCSVRHIQREIRQGNLTAYRPARVIKVLEDDFWSWFKGKQVYKKVGGRPRKELPTITTR